MFIDGNLNINVEEIKVVFEHIDYNKLASSDDNHDKIIKESKNIKYYMVAFNI